MTALRINLPARPPFRIMVCVCILGVSLVASRARSAEIPSVPIQADVRTAPRVSHPREELHRLIAGQATTSQLLWLVEQLYQTGRLGELGSGVLPWAGWIAPGWRWERQLADGSRLVLASDGLVLVAIREGRTLEFSVLDLTAVTRPGESRQGPDSNLGNQATAQHIIAASASDFARQAPHLFPIYYYFAGPTADIVSSHLLPRSVELAPMR